MNHILVERFPTSNKKSSNNFGLGALTNNIIKAKT